MRIGWPKHLTLNFFILSLFIIDRLIKIYFFKNPSVRIGGDFISGLLSLNFEKNIGAAFGININQKVLLVLVIFIILILISALAKAYQKKDSLTAFGLTLIVVGAVSNLIDRLRYGYVVDYIDVPFFTVFNLADVMISFGVGILILESLIKKRPIRQ